MKRLALLTLFISTGFSLWAQSYTISTFAGGGLPAVPAAATNVSVGFVGGVTMDSVGGLYISDPSLNAVLKVSKAGVITIFVGTGLPGYSGDGGPAGSAQLNAPSALVFDSGGDLLIADTRNNAVRKVSPAGTITTIAGNGTPGYSGDGGSATLSTLSGPQGITVDAVGKVYVADSSNNVVRVISTAGIINTFAGNGSYGYRGDGGLATAAALASPTGVAIDSSGNAYIADFYNGVVRKVASGGTITTYAGNGSYGYAGDGGPATSATLTRPYNVDIDASGDVFIADAGNEVIRVVSPAGTITTVAGTGISGYFGDGGPATSADLSYPQSVVVSADGSLFIGDSNNFRVREVSSSGIITTVAGNGAENFGGDNGPGDNGPGANALLAIPSGSAVGSDGSLYFADAGNSCVRKISPSGVITTIAGDGTFGYSGDNGPAVSAQLNYPNSVAVDNSGNVFIADTFNMAIREVSASGVITTVAGNGGGGLQDGIPATSADLSFPRGIAVDNAGSFYIADTEHSVIRKVDSAGIITTIAGGWISGYSGDGGPAASSFLSSPIGIVVDTGGNIYIADSQNGVVREISSDGVITTISSTKDALYDPYGVAVDGLGNLYIADTSHNSIRRVSTSGTLSTIAGTGTVGYSGDGGPALEGMLYDPEGIAVSAAGTVYVTDTYNNVVRTLTPCIQSLASVANADSTGQTLSVPLTAASSCSWSALSLPSWITSASSGTGTGTLALGLQANTTGADRSATISVNGLALTVSQAFTASTFSDVIPGSYYFDAVNLLQGKSITAGCGNDGYCPNATVTRDDMAVFIVRTILGSGTFSYSPTPHFADVASTYFAFPWIQKLYELGITAGCGGTPIDYCPGETVTRDQMAIFLIRARYGPTTLFTWNPTAYFSDVPSSYYAFDWIQRLYQDSVTAGCSSAPLSYCPVSPVLRGDMAIFLMRGAYNQLLPPTAPVISSILPATLAHGTTGTFAVTGLNTAFLQGATQLVFPVSSGIAVNSITVTSATTMQVSLTADAGALLQPVPVYEQTEPEEAVLPNGLVIE